MPEVLVLIFCEWFAEISKALLLLQDKNLNVKINKYLKIL